MRITNNLVKTGGIQNLANLKDDDNIASHIAIMMVDEFKHRLNTFYSHCFQTDTTFNLNETLVMQERNGFDNVTLTR